MATHLRTCNLCEAMCGLQISVEEGRITSIRGDSEDPFSRGHVCPKGPALRELHEDPDRLRQPMRRRADGSFAPVSWKEAIGEASERLAAIRAEHGRNSIGIYVGNPAVHNHGAMLALQGFTRALGTRNRFDANSQDANPRLLASLLMYGDQLAIPIPDVDRTDFLLMLGGNPAASNGSLMTLGDVKGRLRGVRERGGRFVLIDPRRTETAAWADTHHFIRPGGDAALLLALLHVLFAEGRVDEAKVSQVARGLDEVKAAAARMPPERAAPSVGIDAERIRTLAREFAAAPRAIAYGRVGVCLSPLATAASWLIDVLNVVTGNFDREGGVMFPRPAVDLAALAGRLVGNGWGRWRSRVRGLPELGGQLPGSAMAEEIETPGEGRIRAFITLAGNPVLSTANGERLSRALGTLEFMVAIDPFLNETTRHAHLVLPPVSTLSRSHFDLVFHALSVRNTVRWSPPVMPRGDDDRTDWEILYELGMRLGGLRFGIPAVDKALKLAWRAGLRLDADTIIDLGLRLGPYGDRFNPLSSGLNLRRVRAAPRGIDLGPLRPARAERVHTPDHKVELAPAPLIADVARVEAWVEEERARLDTGALTLVGRRQLRDNNSWMHNCPSLVKGPDRSALLVHPVDAARLGLVEGRRVRVRRGEASIEVALRIADEVMPGVVCLPHGFGHAAAAATLRVAGPLPGASINVLTDEHRLDPLSGTAALNGLEVRVEALENADRFEAPSRGRGISGQARARPQQPTEP